MKSPVRFVVALSLVLTASSCAEAPPSDQTVRDHYFYGGLAAFHEGVPADAARQWRRAAELGDAEAARNLGHLYRQGLGVPADGHMAQAWYQVAADGGVVSADYNLGMLQMRGAPDLPPDAEAGRLRLEKAAAAGYLPAQVELDRLVREAEQPAPPAEPPAPATVAAEAPPAPPASPVREVVQIGSYPTRALAEQDWKRLAPAGLSPRIVANRVSGRLWYRLTAEGPAEAVEAFCLSAPHRGVACRRARP